MECRTTVIIPDQGTVSMQLPILVIANYYTCLMGMYERSQRKILTTSSHSSPPFVDILASPT